MAIPNAVPTAASSVEIPKVKPKPAVKEPVAEPVQVKQVESEPERVLLGQSPAEAEVKGPTAVLQEGEGIIPVTKVTSGFCLGG